MKIWKNKFLKQMIIIIAIFFLIINCIAPSKVYANKSQENPIANFFSNIRNTARSFIGFSHSISGESSYSKAGIPGNIVKELFYIFTAIGDVVMSCMQVCFIGSSDMWMDTMLDNKNDNLGTEDHDPGSWIYANNEDVTNIQNEGYSNRGSMLVMVDNDALKDGIFSGEWKVPNILLSPENIFANKIAALDANFINPHKYQSISDSEGARDEAVSLAESISPTIASWYRAFRNLAIVSLLSVLVYIGIRILIGTTSEKAKYKERLTDWFVALCLVFFIHFIMAGIMMLSEKIIDLIDKSFNSGIIVAVSDGTIFRTSFTGYVRFGAQSNAWTEAIGYSIMYFVVIGITLRYVFMYLKRALYLAFFTMIAPLVAITYPIDKAGDGNAQAFNMWLKEYFINAIIQPVHLILYSALIGSAISLAVQNPIYGIVVLLFIATAESWVKRMFKIDQATLTSTSLGDVAILSSMIGMGKNLIGGVAGGVGKIATAGATGGVSAIGQGITKSLLGTPGRAVKGIANRIMGRTVEDNAIESDNNSVQEQSDRNADGVEQSDRNADGVEQSDRNADGVEQSDRNADGVEQSGRNADGVEQSDRNTDGVEQSDRNADGVEQSYRNVDEVEQSYRNTDEIKQSDRNADEAEQKDKKADEVKQNDKIANTLKQNDDDSEKKTKDSEENEQSKTKKTDEMGKLNSQKIDIQSAQLININGGNIKNGNREADKEGSASKDEKNVSAIKPDIQEASKLIHLTEDGKAFVNNIDSSLLESNLEDDNNKYKENNNNGDSSKQNIKGQPEQSNKESKNNDTTQNGNKMQTGNISVGNANIDAKGKTNIDAKGDSTLDREVLKDREIEKLTKKDPSEDVRDQINKALSGLAGGIAGIPLGAVMSGAMGDNKMLMAGPMATATAATNAQSAHIQNIEKKQNKNIKMYVQNNITNKNIIDNATKMGKQKHWSQDKTLTIAKIAQIYTSQGVDLSKDKDSQKEVEDMLREAKVSEEKIQEGLDDIIKIQKPAYDMDKAQKDKKNKNMEYWE